MRKVCNLAKRSTDKTLTKQASLENLDESIPEVVETSPELAESRWILAETRPTLVETRPDEEESAENWTGLFNIGPNFVETGHMAETGLVWPSMARFGRIQTKCGRRSRPSLVEPSPNLVERSINMFETDQIWSSIAQSSSKSEQTRFLAIMPAQVGRSLMTIGSSTEVPPHSQLLAFTAIRSSQAVSGSSDVETSFCNILTCRTGCFWVK